MVRKKWIRYVFLFAGIAYFLSALYNWFIDFERTEYLLFEYNIGRLPYILFQIFLAGLCLSIGLWDKKEP